MTPQSKGVIRARGASGSIPVAQREAVGSNPALPSTPIQAAHLWGLKKQSLRQRALNMRVPWMIPISPGRERVAEAAQQTANGGVAERKNMVHPLMHHL